MWKCLENISLLFPSNFHSDKFLLKPNTFCEIFLYPEFLKSSVSPQTRTHAKLLSLGAATHADELIPHGKVGPWTHF